MLNELCTWKLLCRHTEDFNRFEFKVLTVNKEKFHHTFRASVPGGSMKERRQAWAPSCRSVCIQLELQGPVTEFL